MAENVEIEYKMLLDKQQYEKILNNIKDKAEKIVHTNVYFDNEEKDLAKSQKSIRIRVGGSKGYELTMKEKREKDQLENNFLISNDDYNQIIEEPNKYLYEFFKDLPENIRPLGVLKTTRYEWQDQQGTFALDLSQYHGIEDYEIEFESKTYDNEQYLKDYLKQYDIEFKSNHKTKVQRFNETKELEPLSSVKAFLYQGI